MISKLGTRTLLTLLPTADSAMTMGIISRLVAQNSALLTETMTLAVAIVPKCFLEPGGIQTVMDLTSTDSTSGEPMPVMQMV